MELLTLAVWKAAFTDLLAEYERSEGAGMAPPWMVSGVAELANARIVALLPKAKRLPGSKITVASVYRILMAQELMHDPTIVSFSMVSAGGIIALRKFFTFAEDSVLAEAMAEVGERTTIPDRYAEGWLRFIGSTLFAEAA